MDQHQKLSQVSSIPITFNVLDYGAVGDGQVLVTTALQAAIDACSRAGGGTVFLPAGVYLTGALFLYSNITLYIDAGATVLGSPDPAHYPVIHSRWEGLDQDTYAPLIGGSGLERVAILGRGVINGQGEIWWQRHRERSLQYPRPRLISFKNCSNVLIQGITALNSPSWTVTPLRCENVTIDGITIINPPDSPNTDGINPDSCCNVHISNCHIDVGDDCVTIKSGIEDNGRDRLQPCENITITNCTMLHGHGGVVIGSEMSGDVRNVVIANCVFTGTDRGIRIKTRRGRGGVVEYVRVTNIIMQDILCPFTMNLYYAVGARGDQTVSDRRPRPVSDDTPRLRHIHLSHITARNVKVAAGFIYGLAEMPLQNISLSDISISMSPDSEAGYPEMADGLELMQQAGLFMHNAEYVRLDHVEITGQLGPALSLVDVAEVDLNACASFTPDTEAPVINLQNVKEAFIRNCRAAADTEIFLSITGEQSRGIHLNGNHLARADLPIVLAADVNPDAVTFATLSRGPNGVDTGQANVAASPTNFTYPKSETKENNQEIF